MGHDRNMHGSGKTPFWAVPPALRGYRIEWLRHDLVAGAALFAILVPAGMAYAQAAGLPPVTGLYATVVPLLVYAAVGPSRVLVLGPDSALAPMIVAALIPLAADNEQKSVALAGLLAILIGGILLLGSALKLGIVTGLLSKPIRLGYLNGIALLVAVSQLPTLLGISVEGGTPWEKLIAAVPKVLAGETNLTALLLGVVSLALIWVPRWLKWKVPGVLDWSTGIYNPGVDITKDTTTLYASDRDVFIFLVDDLNPIEAGKLPDGSPDLYFRGFYCWNSEVGAKTLGIASFYLRAVCQNRNLWGVEDFEEITIRHSKYAASRFAHEAAPALLNFANSSPLPFINGIKASRERIVARSDDDRSEFLRRRGFSRAETAKIIDTVLIEEGRPPESIFDFVQGVTAVARDKPHQDARLDMEAKAKKLLDRAA